VTRTGAEPNVGDAPQPRRHSLRFELAAALALVLMMAVVSLALASEWLAGRRHASLEVEQLRQQARGLALVVTPMVAQGVPAAAGRADVEQALRPNIGSSGIVAIEVYRLPSGEPVEALVSIGLAPDVPPPSAIGTEDVARTEGEWTIVDRPLRTFGARANTPLLLRMVARQSPWTSAADWREISLLALGVGVLSFVLGVGLLELQVLRPLSALHAGIRDVGSGNLAARVDEAGPSELRSFAIAFNDMTERLAARLREIEAQRSELARAEGLASLGRIAAGTAHEVGNPLATILGYVELLLDPRHQPQVDPESREMLVRVREQIVRIQNLVGQLLDYSRAERTKIECVALRDTCERMVALLRHDPRCADVELRVEGPELDAAADVAKLDQVLQNLLVNGARAAARPRNEARDHAPIVEVRIVAGDPLAIEIHDNGPGVDDAVRDRLFQPFVTTAKAGEGTGLGLAISAGLVAQMGGTLVCLPDGATTPLRAGDSPGAVFRVTLPSATADRPAANATPPAAV